MQNQHERRLDIGSMSKSMLIVMVFTMVSKVTGFARDILFASKFGMGAVSDAYDFAQNIPCIILSVIIAALSSTMIPVYSSQLKQGKEQANRLASNILTIGMAVSVAVMLLTMAFQDVFIEWIASGASAETKQLTRELSQIMMPIALFSFLARVGSAYLQANFRFATPAISQIFLNIVVIFAIFIPQKADITYVAIGTMIGWMVQFLVQAPSIRRAGLSYRPVFDVKSKAIREIGFLMIPLLISGAFDQIYIFFDRSVVSGVAGDASSLTYASRISTMVSVVLLTTIATTLYPSLARHADQPSKFRDTLSFGINLNLLIALPMVMAFILLRVPITRLIYERGEFSADNTLVTAGTLACYAVGILGVGLRELCNRCFYAQKDTKIPTIVGVAAVVLNIVLDYALYEVWGVFGVALATSVSMLLGGATLLFLLHRKLKVVDVRRIGRCLWKSALATAVMAVTLLALSALLRVSSIAGIPFYASMVGLVLAGIAVYAVTLALLKAEEMTMVLDMVKKKLKRAA